MKKYSSTNLNVPMKFYYVYLYGILPAIVIIDIIVAIGHIYLEHYPTIISQTIKIIINVCIWAGLFQRRYFGYILNKICLILAISLCGLMVVPICAYCFTFGITMEVIALQCILLTIALFSIFILIYFEKRKYLLGKKPPHIEHANNEQASPQQVQTLTCICGSCGKTAKISYAAQTGGSCTVSFVCPYCRTKNVVRNGSREKYNNNHFDFDPSHAYEQTHGRRQNKSNIKAFIARNKILCIVSVIAVLLIAGAFAGGYFAGQNSIIINHSHTVYVSSTGGKYHLYGCKYINKSKILARTIETARKKGYEPCSHCNPDRLIKKK